MCFHVDTTESAMGFLHQKPGVLIFAALHSDYMCKAGMCLTWHQASDAVHGLVKSALGPGCLKSASLLAHFDGGH